MCWATWMDVLLTISHLILAAVLQVGAICVPIIEIIVPPQGYLIIYYKNF